VQGVVLALDNNPSYSVKQKNKALDLTVNFIANAAKRTPIQKQKYRELYEDAMKTTSNQKTPHDDYMDDSVTLPTSYEQLVALAEAEMTREDYRRRLDPPMTSKRPRSGDYYKKVVYEQVEQEEKTKAVSANK